MENMVDNILRKYGLDPILWGPIFKVHQLTSEEAIQVNKHDDELFKELCKHAKTEDDLNILRQIFQEADELTQNEQLMMKSIENEGLNSSYWLPKLKDVLSITSVNSFHHVSDEDLQQLKKYITKTWEYKALRKLFGLPNEKDLLKELRSEQKQKIKEKQEKAQKALDELKKLSEDGRSRLENEVKEKENTLKELLQVPEEHWISKDDPLSKVVNVLEKLCPVDTVTVDTAKQELSDKELLIFSTAGIALKGIFVGSNIEDHTLCHEYLIDTPKDFSLHGPSLRQQYITEEFSSKHQEALFEKNVSNVGLISTVSVAGGIGMFGFNATTSAQYTSSSESSVQNQLNENYLSTKKYCFVPLASCYLEQKHIKLSSSVLNELKAIEKDTNDERVRGKFLRVLQVYGSHANKGPLHFGGMYSWSSSVHGFAFSQKQTLQNITTEALNLHVGASYMGISGSVDVSASHYKGKFEGHYKEDLMHMVKLNITKIGGPTVDNLPQWKQGLIAHNRNWQVIDRGDNFMPVWEIIHTNHKDDFTDHQRVCRLLVDAYHSCTNLDIQTSFLQSEEENIVEKIMQSTQKWDLKNINTKLVQLCEWKNVLLKGSGGERIWVQCLSENHLQKFLVAVISQTECYEAKDKQYVKILLKDLLYEFACSVETFPQRDQVYDFLSEIPRKEKDVTPISKLEDMEGVLKECCEILECSNTIQEKVRVKLLLTQTINSLRRQLHTSEKFVEEMFLVLSVELFGYMDEEGIFEGFLDVFDIHLLSKTFVQGYRQLFALNQDQREPSKKAEAFVLLKAFECIDVIVTGIEVEYKERKLQEVKRKWITQFQTEVKNVMLAFPENYILNIEDFQNHLFCILQDIPHSMGLSLDELQNKMKILLNELVKSSSALPVKPMRNSKESNGTENAISTIRKRLGLGSTDLTMMDALHVKLNTLCEKAPTEENQLVAYLLRKLTKIDYRCIHYCIKAKSSAQQYEVYREDSCDDPFEDTELGDSDKNDTNTKVIHPIDVLITLIASSDMLMQQYIFTKLAICQIALPMITLNHAGKLTFMLWASRMIRKSWKSTHQSGIQQYSNQTVSTAPTLFISFIRMGSLPISKSKMLNCLINNQDHSTFYNRDCEGSFEERALLNGVVEMCWFLPKGEENDKFRDMISFFNLRGDVRNYGKQLEYLAKTSDVIVVLTTSDNFKNAPGNIKEALRGFLGVHNKLFVLFTDTTKTYQPAKNTIKLSVQGKNEATIAATLTEQLGHITRNMWDDPNKQRSSLQSCALKTEECGILLDENDTTCKETRYNAENIMKLTEQKEVLLFKSEALSLQGNLWKQWCQFEKQLCRLDDIGNETIEERRCKIVGHMRNIRLQQLNKAQYLHPFMRTFVEILTACDNSSRPIFLKWMAYYLDQKSQEELPEMRKEYHKIWKQISESDEKLEKKLLEKRTKLNVMDKKISESSLGMEHLMRELGQMFEAVSYMNFIIPGIDKLPLIAAQMLVSGHPVELMDGDAAHVPTTWVSAVLEATANMLKNPHIFIISVLGIQSTGKSTLLNTMFGLQFAVSGGRCTRGAFMQLLPVTGTCLDKSRFSYILVVDTEGLSSPEIATLSTSKHNNELATFVIGIGDITLINVMGEYPADIEGILQITVEAFLRMNKVKLRPRCFFVHQNVGDVSVSELTVQARRKLQERLDKITATALDQQQKEHIGFSNVIKFNIDEDVAYISGLWKGEPPMAPPNCGYSEKIEQLQKSLMEIPNRACMTVSQFKDRVNSLWNALLHENFVFSFRNALEMAVYGKLEKEYSLWKWEMHDFRLQVEQSVRREIQNETFVHDKLLPKIEHEIENKINLKAIQIQKRIEEFFDNSEDKDTLIQWQHGILEKFQNLREGLFKQIQNVCKECIEKRKAMQHLDKENIMYEHKMLTKAKILATELRGKELEENQLQREFENIWREIMTSIPYDGKVEQQIDILRDAESILYHDVFMRQHQTLREKTIENNKPIKDHVSFALDPKKHIKYRIIPPKENEINKVEELARSILENLSAFLKKKMNENTDYNASYFMSIIHDMNNAISEFENRSKKTSVTIEFQIDLALVLFGQAQQIFDVIHGRYVRLTSPKTYLEKKKPEYLKAFRNLYHGAEACTIAADFFTDSLVVPIENSVKQDIGRVIAGELKASETAFNGNRSKLETCILLKLAEKEQFQDYKIYIQTPSKHVERFIQSRISHYYFKKIDGVPYVQKVINNLLDKLKITLCTTISDTTKRTTTKHQDFKALVLECWSQLHEKIDVRESIARMQDQDVPATELSLFSELVLKNLKQLFEKLKTKFNNVTEDDLQKWTPNSLDILKEQLGGCWAICPFCNAVCTNTIENHDGKHSVPFHRPEGLTGTLWERDNTLSTDICSTAISSNYRFVAFLSNGKWYQYKDYQNAGAPYSEWSITPDTSLQKYWKWVVCHFQKEWEEEYRTKFSNIPQEWKNVKKEDIISDLKKMI